MALAKRPRPPGADGLMVLPPYVYKGDWRENKAHFDAVIRPLRCRACCTTTRSRTARTSRQRRCASFRTRKPARGEGIEWRRAACHRDPRDNGDRLAIFAGMDDMILESIPMGATGWVAGLVDALPAESVRALRRRP